MTCGGLCRQQQHKGPAKTLASPIASSEHAEDLKSKAPLEDLASGVKLTCKKAGQHRQKAMPGQTLYMVSS